MSNITNAIESKFTEYQDALVLQQSDLSLKSVSDMVVNEAIDISPKYQRRERWDLKKESDLIESFLLNIPVPPIYLAEDEYGTYSVIDGKQRLTAITNFLTGSLKLHKLERFKELEGLTFDELPKALKNALSIRPYLRVVTLLKQSDSELKHEVFLRLNKAGVALNSQEIRNVAFRGKFNDMLFDLAATPDFSKILKADDKKGKVYREMIDVQFVLRFFTVRHTWNSFPGNMDIAMDSFMREFYRSDTALVNTFSNDFNRALESCVEIWGDEAFMKPSAQRKVLQGFFDIQMVCISMLNDAELANAIAKKVALKQALEVELETNETFLKSVSQFTSNSKAVAYRIERFLDILKGI
ncbi:DUF262 domain-containing protein [Vibrio vulnificus]|nr:DUF262 domain-containing protein [Vibrio vulnificus]EKA7352510.1 DUF262 domain-containing protein [Vibrio vulnificus]MCU8221198.1 DUF262 domain-containing protein [Vibrio vulnificus]MCU8501524.1 DUF262 domain-containing protein [Vibrio vulnificus]